MVEFPSNSMDEVDWRTVSWRMVSILLFSESDRWIHDNESVFVPLDPGLYKSVK